MRARRGSNSSKPRPKWPEIVGAWESTCVCAHQRYTSVMGQQRSNDDEIMTRWAQMVRGASEELPWLGRAGGH